MPEPNMLKIANSVHLDEHMSLLRQIPPKTPGDTNSNLFIIMNYFRIKSVNFLNFTNKL